jgi:zinc finger protein
VLIVKSAEATVKIPELRMTMSPGPASSGFISTIEGLLFRFKKIVEQERDSAEEDSERKSAKNLLKKIWKIECGDIPMRVQIDDPSGNSTIVSPKAVVTTKKKK